MKFNKKIRITQIKSSIGIKKQHKIILKQLNLYKINKSIIKEFNNNLFKFIKNIHYLIKCENIYEVK